MAKIMLGFALNCRFYWT